MVEEIKAFIIESLALEHMTPDQIEDDEPLFGDGLGLDSIDALELGVAIRRRYGIKISRDGSNNREVFMSARAMAKFIVDNQTVLNGDEK
jgi:acyl carrier protein